MKVKKERKIRFCPECGSTRLVWYMGGQIGGQYKCIECNYIGVAMEADSDFIKEFKIKRGLEKAGV